MGASLPRSVRRHAAALLLVVASACAVDDDCAEAAPSLPLSTFAHDLNSDFIAKVASGRAREFRPSATPATFDENGSLRRADLDADGFFTYETNNGWNNQLLNLLCALDMARTVNRTLIVPPFQWPRRRGPTKVSVCRLVDMRRLARFGVRVLCEDEDGSVEGALAAARVEVRRLAGEGQPHRKRRMPRWSREQWVATHGSVRGGVLSVSCCLFWTWALPPVIARELYALFEYHPSLVSAARAAAAPLGDDYAAFHVRRGDKVSVDKAYTAVFGERMSPRYFGRLAQHEGIRTGALVFVATDELDRKWFEPLAQAGPYELRFVDELAQRPLLEALSAFPQNVWADVLAILEQIVCTHAPGGFVGSLPSTLSGHVVNARAVAARHEAEDAAAPPPLLFTKLHESCCDERTERDWEAGGLVRRGEPLPCVRHEPWC